MAGQRAEHAAKVRARIITAAERLFASRGYEATSLQAIADEAGVGKTNVYHYFPAKAGILDAALASAVASVHDLLRGAATVPAGTERALFIVHGYVDLLVKRRQRQPWVLPRGQEKVDRAVKATVEQLTDRAAALVFAGPRTPAQRLLIMQLLALQDAVPRFASVDDEQLRRILLAACEALMTMPGVSPSQQPDDGAI